MRIQLLKATDLYQLFRAGGWLYYKLFNGGGVWVWSPVKDAK